jgi:flagellar hook-associated protein 1 FlgK
MEFCRLLAGENEYTVAPLLHPAGWIEVNPIIAADAGRVAAGFGINGRSAELGEGAAALEIAQIFTTDVMVGNSKSFDDFIADTVADIGLRGQTAEYALETETLQLKSLQEAKDSISGVNLDEELAEMVKFQHGYAAAARFLTEFDKMLDVLINRVGA